jgi:hypothetical protein
LQIHCLHVQDIKWLDCQDMTLSFYGTSHLPPSLRKIVTWAEPDTFPQDVVGSGASHNPIDIYMPSAEEKRGSIGEPKEEVSEIRLQAVFHYLSAEEIHRLLYDENPIICPTIYKNLF